MGQLGISNIAADEVGLTRDAQTQFQFLPFVPIA